MNTRKLKDIARKHTVQGHDMQHIINVARNAVTLARKESADLKVVMAAAYLHGTGGKKDHEMRSALIARRYLEENGEKKEFIDRVCKTIIEHRNSTIKKK